MKRKTIYIFLIFLSVIIIGGCQQNIKNKKKYIEKKTNIKEKVTSTVNVIINEKKYTINLEDNETAKKFINILPNQFEMRELNGNEKYTYLDTSLPEKPYNPRHIEKGDVMLFGNNCLVLFYKSFETSYSYTKIGHIDNLPDLDDSNLTVEIEK